MAPRVPMTNGFWPLYALLGVGAVVLIILGAINASAAWGVTALFAGILGGFVTLATAAIALRSDARTSAFKEPEARIVPPGTPPPIDAARLDALEQAVAELREVLCLSEEARRVLFSGGESDVLRAMIGRAAARGDVDEVARLAHVAEHSLGLPDVAAAGHELIAQIEARDEEERVRPLLDSFESALSRRDWAAAYEAAGAIRQAAPRTEVSRTLEQRIEQAREAHKQSLEQRFLDAAGRDAIDEAMALLKELDRYMRRDEASRLGQVAQAVITRHRDRLGLAFQVAVQERRWLDAARHGNAIIDQYPNTRMAEQVRTMIDVIRTKATQSAVAEAARP